MFGKKVAAAAIVVLAVALASQPAMAGVGGCRFGVGGCGSGQLTSNSPTSNVPVLFDNLRGAVRADYIEILKTWFREFKKDGPVDQGGTQVNEGVGGCRFGVGGCICGPGSLC